MTPSVWFNGALVDTPAIAIDPADRGYLLGDGVFETIAVFHGVPFRLADHVGRMMAAISVLGLGLQRGRIESAVDALVSRHAKSHGILRLTATRGPAPRGLAAVGTPSLLATFAPWPQLPPFEPVAVITASVRRNDRSPASRLKSLSYLDNILAAREAAANGAGDAVMLNTRGRLACSTIANLFVVSRGRIVTPPEREGVLPGITRKLILAAMDVAEQPIASEALLSADEVFLTNSIRLVRPVSTIDGTPLGSEWPVAQRCLALLHRAIAAECGGPPPS